MNRLMFVVMLACAPAFAGTVEIKDRAGLLSAVIAGRSPFTVHLLIAQLSGSAAAWRR